MADRADDWGKYLDAAVFATNTSIQSTTKITPFQMMFGRDPRFPLEAEKESESTSVEDASKMIHAADIDSVLRKMLEKQKKIFKTADERIKLAQQKQKQQYKKRKGIVEYNYMIGDKVLRRNMLQKTRKGNKGEDRWLGPYMIVELSTTSAILQNEHGKTLKTRISLNQLKPYIQLTDLEVGEDNKAEDSEAENVIEAKASPHLWYMYYKQFQINNSYNSSYFQQA